MTRRGSARRRVRCTGVGLVLGLVQAGPADEVDDGLADRRLGIPATPETVYRIAPVSKQFIATGIMLLVQDGRLGLEDSIGPYLGDAAAAWEGITIRHLLTHTAGLVREASRSTALSQPVNGWKAAGAPWRRPDAPSPATAR